MKIKVIDLLNKIANGELAFEQEFKHNGFITDMEIFNNEYLLNEEILNNEIEIIEEVEDKEYEDIEEIRLTGRGRIACTYDGEQHFIDTNIKDKEVYIPLINALIRNQKYILERLDKND